jgi:hypothetical protein
MASTHITDDSLTELVNQSYNLNLIDINVHGCKKVTANGALVVLSAFTLPNL